MKNVKIEILFRNRYKCFDMIPKLILSLIETLVTFLEEQLFCSGTIDMFIT